MMFPAEAHDKGQSDPGAAIAGEKVEYM